MMVSNRSNTLSNLPIEDEGYINQQLSSHSRPMDLFTAKGSDSLPGNWPNDSAMDLFSLTPADMDPVPFDFVDGLANTDIKDYFLDPIVPPAFSALSMPPVEETVAFSSDLDSDGQSWSSGMRQSIDITIPKQPPPTDEPIKLTTQNSSSHSATSTRWSSSPEIKSEEYIAPKSDKSTTSSPGRNTRSFSQDSTRSSPSQNLQTRNAAKRAAHNVIEKRYRTNLNAKFLVLEKAISPANVQKQSSRSGPGAGSLKKSEILTNALAYIENVQQDCRVLRTEVALLKQGLFSGEMWQHTKQPCA